LRFIRWNIFTIQRRLSLETDKLAEKCVGGTTYYLNYISVRKRPKFNNIFGFFTKICILIKSAIFEKNFYIWPKSSMFAKISIFDQNFDFWLKFPLFTKILIFDKNFYFSEQFDFWLKFLLLTKITIFDKKSLAAFLWFKLNNTYLSVTCLCVSLEIPLIK